MLKREFKKPTSRSLQAGFSLIEIIIVVGIIGVIVAIIANRISGGKANADLNLTNTKAASLFGKLLQYQQEYTKYPTTEQGLDALLKGTGGVSIAKEDELKDAWGTKFQYKLTAQGPFLMSEGISQGKDSATRVCYSVDKKLESCDEFVNGN